MDLGWKRLIPASLAWMLLVAGFMISAWWGVGLVAAVLAGAALLSRTFTLGQELEAADQAVLPPVGSRPISPSRLRELTDRTEEDEA
jgi:Zn-dependent membrane protease YugP